MRLSYCPGTLHWRILVLSNNLVAAGATMTTPRFTIRYRQRTSIGEMAVLVEDTTGHLHVCTGSGMRPYLRESNDSERRLDTLRRLGWTPVPRVAPYTLDGLQRLIGQIAA